MYQQSWAAEKGRAKAKIILKFLSEYKDAADFLTQIAKRCGKIKKNGIPDIKKAAQLVLNDWTGFVFLF